MLETTLEAHPTDGAVTFDLRVENRGTEDVELSFSDSQRIRVSVVPADVDDAATPGNVDDAAAPGDADDVDTRWRSDEGEMFMQVLGSETVPAGGQLGFEASWEDPEPGEYRAVGEIVCRERELRDEAAFEV